MKTLYIPLSIFLFAYQLGAQNGDCIRSIEICKKDSFNITFSRGTVRNEISSFDALCFDASISDEIENGRSVWITWKVAKSGTLSFTITPGIETDDIDFIIFKVDDNICSNKKTVRCMATGEGDNCSIYGNTGLKEGETDVNEALGCEVGSIQNNFLAPLNVIAGEQYALFIHNTPVPRTISDNAKIKFGGTALLGCETVSSIQNATSVNMQFYPNPATSDIYIQTAENISNILITNSLGQTVESLHNSSPHNTIHRIPIAHLPIGYYTTLCQLQNGSVYYHKFIKK
jgi:Secretion system C-terminal sorting domain